MAKPRRKRPKNAQTRKASNLKKEEKKKKRMVIGGGLIMVFLMIFSIVGVLNYNPAYNSEIPMKYQDYEFTLESRSNGGQVLVTEINGQQVEFQSLPPQTTHLEVDSNAIELMRNAQQIALVSDPTWDPYYAGNVDYARLQLSLALGKTMNAMNADNDYNQLILNCNRSSIQTPVVMFNLTNETARLTSDGTCITLTAEERELMLIKDRIIFEYYGIMNNGEVVE